MQHADIPAGLNLCRQAGWNQVESDWKVFLEFNKDGCFVAEHEGRVVGTATTISYDKRFAWIGMVLVDAQQRRMGIGTRLLNTTIDYVNHLPCIKLDATPAGREVYLKLGFKDEYVLSRYVAENVVYENPSEEVAHVTGEDLDTIIEIDKAVFGAERSVLLKNWMDRQPSCAFIHQGSEAYCFAREGFNYFHLGPIVATNFSTARAVCTAALQQAGTRPLVIDVPHHSAEWLQWLKSVGFREQRTFTRMYLGENIYPGMPLRQFAICGPEFG
jgi:GNAT superfamily N-acetyltransferase